MSVPHIHHWGYKNRDSPLRCTKCGIKQKDWEKQMALEMSEQRIRVERPEGSKITVAKDTNSTVHLTIQEGYNGARVRVYLDSDECAEVIAALQDAEKVK